jgi:hypothetical protein
MEYKNKISLLENLKRRITCGGIGIGRGGRIILKFILKRSFGGPG